MTPSDPADVLPEAAAAERLRQHLEEIARERDRAHRELQEREAELARIQRIARVGGLEIDFRDGVRNRRSPEYLLVHGLPPEEINETYENWVARIHPEDRERTIRHLFGVLKAGGEDYTAEYRIIRPNDGESRWIRVVAKIERDRSGRALRLVGADLDVTDQMLAQETLRESEERFRLIADSAPVPIWVTKLDRTRSFANRAYLDFLGLPFEEAIVFDWRKALHPDDLPQILQEQITGELSLKPFVLEARYRNAEGDWRWLRSESQPRWDPNGKHIGFIGVAHDITAAKEAEIELRKLNESLERRILERTAQLESREAQTRAILETSHQYQMLLNRDGDLLYSNQTALAAHLYRCRRRRRQAVLGHAVVRRDRGHAARDPECLCDRDARRGSQDRDAAAPADRRTLFRFRDAAAAGPARHHRRRRAGGRRHHRTAPRRGSPAAIAEDGSGRPTHRRCRA
ncbi:PAS domain S-box-containing protein [Bradyrhizobium elkanii]